LILLEKNALGYRASGGYRAEIGAACMHGATVGLSCNPPEPLEALKAELGEAPNVAAL